MSEWVFGLVGAAIILAVVVWAPLVRAWVRRGRTDFDLVVLGGGAAGLTAAGIAATFGAKVLLVDRAKLGGDCTWTGCIPSKTLLRAAKIAHEMRRASRYGLADVAPSIDTRRVMQHVRSLRQQVYDDADAPPIFEAMGIEIRFGRARFVDARTIAITTASTEEQRVRARRVIVATGGRPAVPAIAGLSDVPYLTSESFFELEQLPERLLIVGGGPIGCELAQAAARLGSDVTLVHRGERILPRDEPELADVVARALATDGIRRVPRATVTRVERRAEGIRAVLAVGGREETIDADAILVAAGRVPNVEGLGLDAAGVAFSSRGITVDRRGRATVRHIFACGDVTGDYQFTHMSEHTAKVAATNAILGWPAAIDASHVPWCTFTDPELAHVGARAADLRARGVSFEAYRFPYAKVDRAITDGEPAGLLEVLARRATGRILGASIVGAGAGDLIGELAVAMRNGVTLRQIADTIHPYPTLGLAVRRAADQWYVRKRSRRLVRFLQSVRGYRGAARDFDPNEIV